MKSLPTEAREWAAALLLTRDTEHAELIAFLYEIADVFDYCDKAILKENKKGYHLRRARRKILGEYL